MTSGLTLFSGSGDQKSTAPKKPLVSTIPFSDDYLDQTKNILRAHQILFAPLSHFYWGNNETTEQKEDFSDILYVLRGKLTKLISVVIRQRNDISHQNYTDSCYDSDTKVIKMVAKLFRDWGAGPFKNNFVEKIDGIFKDPIGTSDNANCTSLRGNPDLTSIFPTYPLTTTSTTLQPTTASATLQPTIASPTHSSKNG